MELCGHVLGILKALRPYCSFEVASKLIKFIIPKMVEPDTIRCLALPTEQHPEIVKYGRGYSHCTDGCAMSLPIGDELKNFRGITTTKYLHKDGYVNKCADEPTNFELFFSYNQRLFAGDELIWGLAILAHLQQDVASDTTWQNNLCECEPQNKRVTYKHSGRVVTDKQFRDDMKLANVWFHRYFRLKIREEFGDEITQEWLNEFVCQAFYEDYSESMAENSCSYMNMDPRVFDDSEETANALIEEFVEKGLISCEADLKKEADMLIGSAVGACAVLVNHLVRLQ